MAVKGAYEDIFEIEDWYGYTTVDSRSGLRAHNSLTECANRILRQYEYFKREMDTRVAQYEKYEKQASAEVVTTKPDLPNISSGESAGFIRRMARNVVQHTPNLKIVNKFDDDSIHGIISEWILKSKIVGDEDYSNNMQQNLVTTARRGFAIGFDCVTPVLQQRSDKSFYILYDNIHYRDVFPDPGSKDIRRAPVVYVRRYLSKAAVHQMIKQQPQGWDIPALMTLYESATRTKEFTDHESKKHSANTETYEVITRYTNDGAPFLTWAAVSGQLLRIEQNVHPLKEHPVIFYVPERDENHPFGKSLLSLTFGRQEFQDLFMNGAMKMFARNVNPPIFGYGAMNAVPNLSPGKYNPISNPNAKIEPFEINTQSLLMFGQISQQNAANMVQLLGAADQQMAMQSTGGMMSQTPQGVEAQQQMVDITTNDYQKAMELFFSRYCSYGLTLYFQELQSTKKITPTADARESLIGAGLKPEAFDEDGSIEISYKDLAVMYNVQVIPGSLVELEDEKQIRILNDLLIPLSQALPALAQVQDPTILSNAAAAMQYIYKKQIELSGAAHAKEIAAIFTDGPTQTQQLLEDRQNALEEALGGSTSELNMSAETMNSVLLKQQEQISLLTQGMSAILAKLGVGPVAEEAAEAPAPAPAAGPPPPALAPGGGGGQPDTPAPRSDPLAPLAPR